MLSLSGHSPKTAALPKRLKYIAAAMIVAIAAATSICIYVLNNNLIGGSSYSTLRTSATTIEQIALIRSTLFQIENTVSHLATDHEAGLEKLKSLTTQTDQRLSGLPALLSTEDSHTAAVKSDTVWKEYKKTLLEEIVPAAKQSNIIKVNYLTTGIQAQRLTIMDKGLARLSAELREGIEQTEQGIVPAGDINLMLAGLVAAIVAGMSALCLLFYHAHPKPLPEGVPAVAPLLPDHQKQHETHLSAKPASYQDQIIYAPLIALGCPRQPDADYAGIADRLIKTVKALSENIDEILGHISEKTVSSLQIAEGIDDMSIHAERMDEAAADIGSAIDELAISMQRARQQLTALTDTMRHPASSEESARLKLESLLQSLLESSSDNIQQVELIAAYAERVHDLIMFACSSSRAHSNFAALTAENTLKAFNLTQQLKYNCKTLANTCQELSALPDRNVESGAGRGTFYIAPDQKEGNVSTVRI